MSKYKVVVVGMGKRGGHHASAFQANGNFEVVGLCDVDEARLAAAKAKYPAAATGTNALEVSKAVKPDVFCFCTLPTLRSEMVKIGIESGAKLIAFEKPVALDSIEGFKVKQLLDKSGVKAVVSHQHRYGEHYRKTKEIIASGALGNVHTVYGSATGWMMHMLSHLIDYTSWFNNYADPKWVMAQAAGDGKFADVHSSPDYIAGFVQYANGVRGVLECGAGAPDIPEAEYWWKKCRMGAQGSEGFAEVLTGNGWRAVTKATGACSGPGAMNYDLDMPPYIQEIADWLGDDKKVHPCQFSNAYQGFEIMMAMCRSVVKGGQIALPLTEAMDEMALLKSHVHGKVLLSSQVNAKEFPGGIL